MKKYFIYILIALLWYTLLYNGVWAEIIDIPFAGDIEDVSIDYRGNFDGSVVNSVNSIGFSILNTVKVILSAVLLIYVVYIGVQMIISLWEDGEELSAAKRQLSYVLIALVFINIPGTLYDAFFNVESRSVWDLSGTWSDPDGTSNIFVNFGVLESVIWSLIGFLQIVISGIAIIMIIISGIRLIVSWSDEEQRKNSIQKVIWSIVALIFVWFIELIKSVAITGNIGGPDGVGWLFGAIINIALFLAAPIAMIFLTIAGFYYITSNGDEERVKKAKNIVVYTVIGTVLLLAIFTFLVDLANLF